MRMKGFFLIIDALLAFTIVMFLSVGVVSSAEQAYPANLIELHKLGRDYLVLNYKYSAGLTPADFYDKTGFRIVSDSEPNRIKVSSRVVVYPQLCQDPGTPNCFLGQDLVDGAGNNKNVENAVLVSP